VGFLRIEDLADALPHSNYELLAQLLDLVVFLCEEVVRKTSELPTLWVERVVSHT
jgi:flagellar biosynthesis/type III secretory pathway protein FliH